MYKKNLKNYCTNLKIPSCSNTSHFLEADTILDKYFSSQQAKPTRLSKTTAEPRAVCNLLLPSSGVNSL